MGRKRNADLTDLTDKKTDLFVVKGESVHISLIRITINLVEHRLDGSNG